MKTQTKAIVASVVVIALCLSAVSGITYSWFSDTEETSIDVSTAVLDIDVDIGNPTCNSTIGTTAIVSGGNISINNIAANTVVSIPYEVSYTTTVKTVYRISASISDAELTDYDRSNIMLNGTSISVRDNGVMEIVEWTPLDSSNNTTTKLDMNNLVISTKSTYGGSDAPSDWSHTTLKNFSIRIVAEMYQGDYPYAKLSEGAAQIPENGVVSGEANTAEGVSKGFSTTIDFSGVNQINSSETEITEYTVTAASSLLASNTDFKIENNSDTIVASFSLTDSTQQTVESATFDNPVTVTIIVDGDYSDANVVYLGNGENPTILSKIYDGASTTIVFTTTHFSDFGIFRGDVPVISENGLKIAFSAGVPVKLHSDIKVTNTINLDDGENYYLDLNGKSITSTCDLFYAANKATCISKDFPTRTCTDNDPCFTHHARPWKTTSLTIIGNDGCIDTNGSAQTCIVNSMYNDAFELKIIGGSYNTKKFNDDPVLGQYAFNLSGGSAIFDTVKIGSEDSPVYAGIWASYNGVDYLNIENSTVICGTEFSKTHPEYNGGLGIYVGVVNAALIKNSTIFNVYSSGGTAVEVKSGDVDIVNCKLSANGFVTDFSEINHNGSGLGQSTLVINDGYSNHWKSPVDVTISGGTITNSSTAKGCKPVIIATDGYDADKCGVKVTLSAEIGYVYGFTPAKDTVNDYQYAKSITIVTVYSNGNSTSQTFSHNNSSVA